MSNSFSSENRIFIVSSFRKRLRAQFENFFFFSLHVRRLVVVRLFSYTVEEAGHSSIFDEQLVREIFSSTAKFRLVTFFFWFKRCFTFLIDSFVRIVRERPGDVNSSIEPVSRIILDHRSNVRRHNAPFKYRNISDGPSLFSYFESTSFANLYFSLSEKRTRQSYELMYMLFCRESNGEYFEKKILFVRMNNEWDIVKIQKPIFFMAHPLFSCFPDFD